MPTNPHHHQGHHAHHSHDDIDWAEMAAHLEREAELRLPFLEEAAAWVRGLLLEGGWGAETVGRVLDVGSGPGVATAVLAHAFPTAETVAVDSTPGLLERVTVRAEREGVHGRVSTLHAELPDDFGELGAADVIWTSHVVHHIGDQQAALDAFAASLTPGGMLAVVERGLGSRCLPRDIGLGRPGLQVRMEAAWEDWFTRMRAELPGAVDTVEDWPGMLIRAGLEHSGTRTFLIQEQAPLSEEDRAHLHGYFARGRDMLADDLPAEDLTTLDTLLDENSPDSILHRPDAFYLAASTVHTGRRAG
ncbi:class I SAM-dependent methyltransferase [Streptomyces sp. HNM0574]|uniref:class I SAM-dependent methyltransferase n=1 Tax=Streptomyces sp. HNM0574 TaxID=2714954 RepID=UPI00146A8067|nr:class I SAM-dependent methyltransferase [Streptomyces sp. HNM0574]NLU66750.1 class I SAM-dependent methyltransferase [Streptomyces sp. HNM0574]